MSGIHSIYEWRGFKADEHVTFTLDEQTRNLYGQGKCDDPQWNAILDRDTPQLIAKGIGKVQTNVHGFLVNRLSQLDGLDSFAVFDRTGPAGFDSYGVFAN
jgi:hypothetical protein